ncbi:MAG: alpha/beta fold hydrolase [Chitinophagaceae bacterium]|nr:MAG: alpha/beta fold hydrolase [Chitinophagaceae bacterium]
MNKNNKHIISESIFLDHPNGYKLHLKRFRKENNAKALLMLHGSIENGKIFYSNSGKGLGPYLAEKGYDVFIPDLRGRGQSTPTINKDSDFGHFDVLEDDFPFMINYLKNEFQIKEISWLAHSWGGVLMLAYLADCPQDHFPKKMVFIGTKRYIGTKNLKKLLYIDFFWNFYFKSLISKKGFLPDKLPGGMGSDKETKKSYEEITRWINETEWMHPGNKFNYADALRKIKLPPSLYITGSNDKVLGNPKDVIRLINETDQKNTIFKKIGKADGFKKNYGHIDILTGKEAKEDVYPFIENFLSGNKD